MTKGKGKQKQKRKGPTQALGGFRTPSDFKQRAGKSMQKHTIRRGRAG